MPSEQVHAFALDPLRLTLNHGSFGACMKSTLARQDQLRAEMEEDPTGFFEHRFPVYLSEARVRLAALMGADEAGMVFVANATTGVSTVSSMAVADRFGADAELLTTSHVYPACGKALGAFAARSGGRMVVADVPFPIGHEQQVHDAVMAKVTARTRLVLLDHVTSPTGLVFPIAGLVRALEERGIPVLIDGAHAPGMVPPDLRALGASYYTANLHKWLCGPKASAFLWARDDRRADLHPLVVSHGHGRGLFEEFDWTGTLDPTALFATLAALDGLATLHADGLAGVLADNRARALRAQASLCGALSIEPPAPESMIGSLVSVPLPPLLDPPPASLVPGSQDPDRIALEAELCTRVPFFPWPDARHRLLRLSLASYVSDDDVAQVAGWLRKRFGSP